MSDATDKSLPEATPLPEIEKVELADASALVPAERSGIVPVDDAWRFAHFAIRSGMVPSCFKEPSQVLVAIQTGAEVGLSPMQAVRSVYVVNGAPAWVSKAARALVRKSGLLKPGTDIMEWITHADHDSGEKCVDDCAGHCKTWRVGTDRWAQTDFSVRDAKTAGLWEKRGKAREGRPGAPTPWITYPNRMLVHRAVGFNLDDHFSDVLLGLQTVAVVQDWPAEAFHRDRNSYERGQPPAGGDPLLGGSAPAVSVAVQKESEKGDAEPSSDAAPADDDVPYAPTSREDDFALEGQ